MSDIPGYRVKIPEDATVFDLDIEAKGDYSIAWDQILEPDEEIVEQAISVQSQKPGIPEIDVYTHSFIDKVSFIEMLAGKPLQLNQKFIVTCRLLTNQGNTRVMSFVVKVGREFVTAGYYYC